MADNWDLYAVVRSCTTTNKSNNTATRSNKANNLNLDDIIKNETWPKIGENDQNPLACLASLTFEQDDDPFGFPNLIETNDNDNPFEELEQFYKPFYNPSPVAPPPPPPVPRPDVGVDLAPDTPRPTMTNSPDPHLGSPFDAGINGGNNSTSSIAQPNFNPPNMAVLAPPPPPSPTQYNAHAPPLVPFHPPIRPRKRKSQQKKAVCLVTAENLSSDMWAWRKYGQKPIKGSPYPRNYYRCSSSKGCSAKKQVERSIMEPNMFTVSYTGEHNHPRPTHRNSLAGSTRTKFTPLIAPKPENGAVYFPALTLSPTTPLMAAPVVLAHKDGIDNMDIDDDNMDIDEKAESQEFAEREGNNNRNGGDDGNLLIPNSMAMNNNEDIFLGLFEGLGGGFGPSPSSSSADTFSGSH